jgi:asparagine synthase (glutamine-hydrolysing)
MCGIAGMVSVAGSLVGAASFSDERAGRWRDLMARRGPNGGGLWRHRNALLLHRRLSVIDPSPAGAQPMLLDDLGVAWSASGPKPSGADEPRFAMVYNGELYNDAELRRELASRGVRFRTSCDTETVLHALAAFGPQAFARLRGMYAIALFDLRENTLLLARDPLGIKPLCFHVSDSSVMFASEPRVVAAHPDVPCRPNLWMAAAYLTTIRTVLGNQTMYEGVLSLRPGQGAFCDFSGERPAVSLLDLPVPRSNAAVRLEGATEDEAVQIVRETVTDSVKRHLRSDVPTCCLLSGGLDSTIVTGIARGETDLLRTYCAGAALPCDCRDAATPGDFAFAARASEQFGTRHSEARITREQFGERWAWMVSELGTPLSTPNEVAIWSVADRLRADGCIVTLSGEGADELFAGYEGPMRAAWACARRIESGEDVSPSDIEMNDAAWVPPSAWGAVLDEEVLSSVGGPGALQGWYADEFALAVRDCGGEGGGEYSVQSHLRFHQRVNLVGLLQRLDTATMLAGVEGRTPLADVEVMSVANALPMAMKCRVEAGVLVGGGGGGDGAAMPEIRTKIALREAFAGDVPASIVERPKASFPMPFQGWMEEHAGLLTESPFAQAVFTDAARTTVAAQPEQLWRLAWPMINLAMWGRRF